MTNISFQLPAELAADINRRAGEKGVTPSTFVAAKLPLWLQGEDLMDELTDTVERLNRMIDEATAQ